MTHGEAYEVRVSYMCPNCDTEDSVPIESVIAYTEDDGSVSLELDPEYRRGSKCNHCGKGTVLATDM